MHTSAIRENEVGDIICVECKKVKPEGCDTWLELTSAEDKSVYSYMCPECALEALSKGITIVFGVTLNTDKENQSV
jgi:hypothetical protein